MHHVWDIAEIRWQILEHFNLPMRPWQPWNHPRERDERQARRRTLVSLARTCTALSDDALALLWESMYSLIPLLRLIPVYHDDVDNPSLTISELTPACLERYTSYSRRVRYFFLRPPDAHLEEHEYMAITAALSSNEPYLLPNLRMLHINTRGTDSLEDRPEIAQYLTSTQCLTHLYIPYPAGMPSATPLISDVIRRSPLLTHLSLDIDLCSHYIDTTLVADLTCVRPALRVLDCRSGDMHHIFQILTLTAQSLERIRVSTNNDRSFSEVLMLAPSGFPVLQECHINLNNPGIRLLEMLRHIPLPSLRVFSLTFEDVEEYVDVESPLGLVGEFLGGAPAIGKQLGYLTLCLPAFLPGNAKTFWTIQLTRFCPNLTHLALSFGEADRYTPESESASSIVGVEVPPLITMRHLRICHPLAVLESGWRELTDRIKFPVLEVVEVHSDTRWIEDARDTLKSCAIELLVWTQERTQVRQMERWSKNLLMN
ncbi:hypothetical protein Hypma_005900 [Hypsizygus marmoreus]|uniref:F-box domain-containing protein n=1 Tax=Hypsizygus marmoreus TaxID=39966 RepID=A0A369KB72_HYPMA|nr:hypothetical protein Hypma_005900 [Hypsizygus marmoreus]